MKPYIYRVIILIGIFSYACTPSTREKADTGPRRVEILFLGHESEHHNSAAYMPLLASALAGEGINLTYTDELTDLNKKNLTKYDGLIIYANHDEISSSQEEALLEFVEGGKGFVPVHCASFCFRNSDKYVALVGAQFKSHETGTFQTSIVNEQHPAIQNVREFSTWDETYVHDKHNEDRSVLMERVEGDHREPWTWVREYGKGRVFYTAYGHDERTWDNPGFHQLMKQGILWAVGDKVKQQWQSFMETMPALVYRDVPNIPNYEKRDPAPQYQEPLSAEESQKLIQVPKGFELQLFASEPDIINPIAMDWDEKGRLWVIETVDYPNTVRNEAGTGDDRIKICEDTDGDGKADKFTVFADNLNIPTSMVLVNGGVMVAQAPEFLFLKDTDGDDKADVRETVIEGWGTFDTHAGPSNLKYGIDNQIWGVVGYSGYEGTIASQDQEFKQGIYHFTPDVSQFEYLTSTSNNTWGLGFTEDNEIFASTANNTHSVYLGIPNRHLVGVEGIRPSGSAKIDGHYPMHPITKKVRQVDVFGGFTAASGHNFYTARTYPEKFWNKIAFVCEPTGHLVHMARIEKDGTGYREKDGWNLFASADEWVSPVEAKVGPDGMVWVLDWYNFIIQHNPTPSAERGGYQAENGDGNAYINPLRDREHGRVWRIVYTGADAQASQLSQLDREKPKELVNALKNDNMFWRITAQRLLVELGETDLLPDLFKLVNNNRLDETGQNYAAMHALWVLHGLGVLDGSNDEAYQVAVNALNHSSPAVRKAAVQVLPKAQWVHQAFQEAKIYNDPDPNTRMSAILYLAELEPSVGTGGLLYEFSKEELIGRDKWLSRAVHVAAARHKEGFMTAYLEENPDFEAEMEQAGKESEAMADPNFNDSDWEEMTLPGFIEAAGLDIDGVVWFRKIVDIPADSYDRKGFIYLNAVDDSDETFVNGIKVGGMLDSRDVRRYYPIPEGVLKPGKNQVTIKLTDMGGSGGFSGDRMVIGTEKGRVSLNGGWKYKVSKVLKSGDMAIGSLVADNFMQNYWGKSDVNVTKQSGEETSGRIIDLSVVKNEMKYSLEEFTVKAGERVTIVFSNPDFMQHNLLIIQPGTLETVGKAADALAADPQGAEMNYVPKVSEVLFSTKLIDPNETVKLSFTVPDKPGEYPFVCTFPGHWRTMNGTMKVVDKNQSL